MSLAEPVKSNSLKNRTHVLGDTLLELTVVWGKFLHQEKRYNPIITAPTFFGGKRFDYSVG